MARTHGARRARLMSATPKRDHEDARPATGSPPVAPGEAGGPSKHARGPAGRMHGGYLDDPALTSSEEEREARGARAFRSLAGTREDGQGDAIKEALMELHLHGTETQLSGATSPGETPSAVAPPTLTLLQ